MWAADGGFHVEHHYTRIDEAPLGETVPKRTQDWVRRGGRGCLGGACYRVAGLTPDEA